MASEYLVRAGRLVVRAGRLVLGRCAACCGGPSDCAFYRYLPCFDDTGLPPEACPLPDPVYVTTCWRCTSGGPSTDILQDTAGFCWHREDDQRYLPDPGTGEEPPAGFEWIPSGAVVWGVTSGPCKPSCLDQSCRLFDEFIPAKPCACSPSATDPTGYFRCSDLESRTACVVGRLPKNGRCYEIDFSRPSVPGPVDPLLIIPRPFFENCCRCCDSLGFGCESGVMQLRNRRGCPLVVNDQQSPVCCDEDYIVQVGASVVLDFRNRRFFGCPPDRYERWWYFDRDGGRVWFKHTTHGGGSDCTEDVFTGTNARGAISCTTGYRYEMLPSFPTPDNMPNFCFPCDAGGGTFVDDLNTMSLIETPSSSRFSAVYRESDNCSIISGSASAVVARYTTRGPCATACASGVPGLTPALPPLTLTGPPGDNATPESLGFITVDVEGPGGILIPKIVLPGSRREPVVQPGPRRNTRCRNCGNDGGL